MRGPLLLNCPKYVKTKEYFIFVIKKCLFFTRTHLSTIGYFNPTRPDPRAAAGFILKYIEFLWITFAILARSVIPQCLLYSERLISANLVIFDFQQNKFRSSGQQTNGIYRMCWHIEGSFGYRYESTTDLGLDSTGDKSIYQVN
jgi:hypothetical protein